MMLSSRILNLSILVVGKSPELRELQHSLQWQKRKMNIKGDMKIDLCEVITDVLSSEKAAVYHDFVVLTFDMRMFEINNEIRSALKKLKKQVHLHRVCLLSVVDVPSCEQRIDYDDISKFTEKYGIPCIFGDIRCKVKCLYLAERILTLVSATMGLKTGRPTIF
ncbi:Uncharacterized protein GBIM_14699 [Gryllus bimaculatus]|nr:Uncharacterized protein GBIM_14699 [Gryllus bimaculatus]